MAVTLIRYWGSYFKNPHHSHGFAAIFARAAVKGWRTYLVCCRPPDDPHWLAPFQKTGTGIEYLPRARGNFDARCVQRVFKLCRRLRCDILHCDNMHTSPLIGSTLARAPVRIWSKRSMEPAFETERALTLRDRLAVSVRLSCRLATRTLTVSRAVKEQLVDLGIPPAKLVIFPNPVDKNRLDNLDRDKARAQLGYNNHELVITTVGHAVPVKGWDILLQAFGRIASKVPEVQLLFVGNTTDAQEHSYAESLEGMVEQLGVAGRVRFAGHLQDVFVALAASDIFVFPSRSEGYGIALMEAIVAGLPCVAARVGVAPDVIQHGQNGFLVDRGDDEAMAAFMLELARDSELRRRFSCAARSNETTPSQREYAERLVGLYESLLNQSKKRPQPRAVVGRKL